MHRRTLRAVEASEAGTTEMPTARTPRKPERGSPGAPRPSPRPRLHRADRHPGFVGATTVRLWTDHCGLTGTRNIYDYRRETVVTRLHPSVWPSGQALP